MKKKLTVKFGDILFLVTMSLVAAFPNPSVYKAIMVTVFFLFTTVMSVLTKRGIGPLLHVFWAVAFYIYAAKSVIWAAYPASVSEVITNVQWTVMLSLSVVNYVCIYRLSAIDIAKRVSVLGIVFLVDVMMNGTNIDGRFTVVIGDYILNENVFGQIAMGIACYMIYWAKKKNWKAPLLLLGSALLLVLALMSGSRKCIISLAVFAIGFILYEYPPKNPEKSVFKLVIVAAIGFVVYTLIMNVESLYESLGSRIESLFMFLEGEEMADRSARARMEMIQYAYKMFEEKPLSGYGLNTFRYVAGYGAYAHNNYMELLANLGALGFCIYYFPLLIYTTMAIKMWVNSVEGSVVPLAVILVYIINDFFSVSYFSMISHLFLGLAIGMIYNLSHNAKQGKRLKKHQEVKKNAAGGAIVQEPV